MLQHIFERTALTPTKDIDSFTNIKRSQLIFEHLFLNAIINKNIYMYGNSPTESIQFPL